MCSSDTARLKTVDTSVQELSPKLSDILGFVVGFQSQASTTRS